MSYKLDWEDEGYYLKMWGVVTTDDMNNALSEIWSNHKSDYMKYCIRDYLDVSKVDIKMSEEEVVQYVSSYEKNTTTGSDNSLNLIAFLSQNEEMNNIIAGYSAIMKKFNPDTEFKNFSNVDDAREWISRSSSS